MNNAEILQQINDIKRKIKKMSCCTNSGAGDFLGLSDVAATAYTGQAGKVVVVNVAETGLEFQAASGTGTVTTISVATANGFLGTVANATTTPVITLKTSVTGILYGNGTGVSAASTTGTGSTVVLDTSPTLVTPILGIASATSINKVAITTPATAATLTIANNKTFTVSNTLTFTGTDSASVDFGAGGTVAYLSNKLSAFAATTSSELASVISDETGTGLLVFGTAPTFSSNITIGTTGTTTGSILLKGSTSGTMTITVPAAAGNLTYTFPSTLTNGYVLSTDASGNLSWIAQSGGGSSVLSAITAATGTNTIDNAGFTQTWNWNSLTTANGFVSSSNSLTTGFLQSLTHSTSVIANTGGTGGSLLNISSTGANTSTNTGSLLNLSSTASLSGTQFLQTYTGITTGFGQRILHTTSAIADGGALFSIRSSGVNTAGATTGSLVNFVSTGSTSGVQFLQTYSALTTGVGQKIIADALSSGTILELSSSSIAATGNTQTGLKVSLTGTSTNTNQTTIGVDILNSHPGATATTIALRASANGATSLKGFAAHFIGANNGGLLFGDTAGTDGAIWSNAISSPSSSNYAFRATASVTTVNAATSVLIALGGSSNFVFTSTGLSVTNTGSAITGVRLGAAFAPGASANYGTLSIGGGAFNGSTAGFFVGHSSGTSIAVNEVSGYAGDLMNLSVGGGSTTGVKFRVDNLGFFKTPNRVRVSTQFDKTADTTLANVTGLSVNVAAAGVYSFTATLFTTSNSGGGVKVAIGGTATATSIIYEGLTSDAGTTTQSRTTTLGNAVGAVTAVSNAMIRIMGTIVVNAAGTLTVQFAQNASNATASSVLVNSTFDVQAIF